MRESYIEIYWYIKRGGEDFDCGVEVFHGANRDSKCEKFLLQLKKKKDTFDQIENGVKNLWKRDGFTSSSRTSERYKPNLPRTYVGGTNTDREYKYENKSPFNLTVWIL